MANHRLPCPASGTVHTGFEDPKAGQADPYKDCNSPNGVVPWAAIGLRRSDVLDNWGRYVAYRVFDGNFGFTQSTIAGFLLADCLNEPTATVYTLSNGSNGCNSVTHENTFSDYFATWGINIDDMGTNNKAAYALISMGASGRGAYYPGGTSPIASPPSGSSEYLNAGSGGSYVIKAASDSTISADSDSHFDDAVSYVSGVDLARNANYRPGAAWKLSQIFSQSSLGLCCGNFNTQAASIKVRPSGTNQGPVMVTASSSRVICATSTLVVGIAPCFSSVTNGNDLFETAGGENLTFDFRVTRSVLVIAVTDFKSSGAGGSNKSQAQLTFYNGSTQVDQKTVQSCQSSGHPVSQHTITPVANFTKVTVTALPESASANSSQFGVAAVLACKATAECPNGTVPLGITWPSIDCYSAPI